MPSKRPVISVLSPGFKIPPRGGHDSSHSLGAVLAPICSRYLIVLIFSCNLLRGSQIYPSLSHSPPLGGSPPLPFISSLEREVYNASLLFSSPLPSPFTHILQIRSSLGRIGVAASDVSVRDQIQPSSSRRSFLSETPPLKLNLQS